jgi:enoyl-CoA hydratase
MKTITLSGPGKNALSTALMERTLGQIQEAREEPIFLTGDGDAFSAGLNIKEVASLDVAGMTKFLGALEDLVKALYEHPAPVVAWVNGHAIAGGCVLALCTDVRFATAKEGVRIGLNEVAIGLRFPPLTLQMVRSRLTRPACERALLEAGLHSAASAKTIGFIDEIGEEAEARATLSKLASYPRDIYAATKLLLRPRLTLTDEEKREFHEGTVPYWASPEKRASLLSMLDKKKS